MVIYFLKYREKYRPTPKEHRDFINWEHCFFLFSEYAQPHLLKIDGYVDDGGYQCFYCIFNTTEAFDICKDEFLGLLCVDDMEDFFEFKEEIVFTGTQNYYFQDGFGS